MEDIIFLGGITPINTLKKASRPRIIRKDEIFTSDTGLIKALLDGKLTGYRKRRSGLWTRVAKKLEGRYWDYNKNLSDTEHISIYVG